MNFYILTFLYLFFLECNALVGPLEPPPNGAPIVSDLRSSVEKMRRLLVHAPDKNSQEKANAFISLDELEKAVEKVGFLASKGKTSSEVVLLESNEQPEALTETTPEEATEAIKQLTRQIWKATDDILRAYTGIGGLVGALPPQTIS
ncbi:hypothetical protein cand_020430 [Cryptosporidium andersoni]|uniref:Uncharacterized protein n=1 Tax=Cryptosporidium andersoni TaxID=117008 RepID=A0A1J4MWC2_9CRYT|nr:hypothetical protein cand_020430 [Cryptosporidium andersoni]